MTTTASTNYWSLLGLDPGSDHEELKRAFRREARKWHPDLNINDIHAEERFKLVNEAYAVLSDPRRRAEWEKSLDPIENMNDPFAIGFPSFEDYLDIVLGVKNTHPSEQLETNEVTQEDRRNWPTRVQSSPPPVQAFEDIESLVALTPEQALYGTDVELELEDGRLIEVPTPPLAGDGWRLRLAGVAPGGKDHFLQLRVTTEDGLRIDGIRVHYRLELLPPDAVLGCAVEVPTMSGTVTLQVPPSSSSGRLLRLRGRGLELDGRRGDQLVEIVVVIPSDTSEAEFALYKRLQELSLDPEAF
ncbi:DnaJ domain-containing protein [Prochlorococcus sp. MIT 1300]|uniref:DnaJ domain-containing protein n=1 Tax=Prochlorococcus sp. MIT 1300 TaxID=3096218 RepID=UPI002A751C89|nr:DnaJ domain-containing protein [Prochlorococcus sp. MIT 1300]